MLLQTLQKWYIKIGSDGSVRREGSGEARMWAEARMWTVRGDGAAKPRTLAKGEGLVEGEDEGEGLVEGGGRAERGARRSTAFRLTAFRSTAFFAVALLSTLAAWAQAARAETCGSLREQGEAAQRAGQVAVLQGLYDQVAVAPDCSDVFRAQFGRLTARAIEKHVFTAVSNGASLEAYEAELRGSARYAKLWRISAWLGDIEKGRKNYAQASLRYQEALATIQDEALTPAPPAQDAIAQIFRRAEQTRLLADSYVAPPVTRAGTPTGLAAPQVRGFVPTKVALPIEFHYNSTAFTENGMKAAEDLLASLKAQNQPNVTLVGHTDPIGSDEFNDDLSMRRAAATRDWLAARGYAGRVDVLGRGKREPLAVDDPSEYNIEQLYRLYRRVELRR